MKNFGQGMGGNMGSGAWQPGQGLQAWQQRMQSNPSPWFQQMQQNRPDMANRMMTWQPGQGGPGGLPTGGSPFGAPSGLSSPATAMPLTPPLPGMAPQPPWTQENTNGTFQGLMQMLQQKGMMPLNR